MDLIRKSMSSLFTPIATLVGFGLFLLARQLNWSLELALSTYGFALIALTMALERFMPFNAHWNTSMDDTAIDATSAVTLLGITEPLLKWMIPLLAASAYAMLDPIERSSWFLADLPFIGQILLVTLLAEFGKYWAHRWRHRYSALWWLHALHHGSERLYALNNFRVHPLDYAFQQLVGMTPLFLLNTPQDVIFGYVALTQPILLLQHANLPLRHGWLNYIFSTNELHRWHHSANKKEGDRNFGSALIVWDWVFGTFHLPNDSAPNTSPIRIGLYQPSRYPARKPYLAQVLSMFSANCCKA